MIDLSYTLPYKTLNCTRKPNYWSIKKKGQTKTKTPPKDHQIAYLAGEALLAKQES